MINFFVSMNFFSYLFLVSLPWIIFTSQCGSTKTEGSLLKLLCIYNWRLKLQCTKLFRVHATHYLINVGCCQVGVAFRHLGGLVAQYFADG